ncbi:hypothetical protein FRX31_020369 [Thalictrum thalictroides]|uniref:Uncharacterized protein n=1 Tax=Thalictrum thalictroides TaxID=46969 RepID=A0A7J6VY35_THATH|nr:hypothetical protein FRX31_020369 [Thalictrum thalictroides]
MKRGGESSKLKVGCYVCGTQDHWAKDCKWTKLNCIKGCPSPRPMKVFVSKTNENGNYGRQFLRCNASGCSGSFAWLDELMAAEKVKVENDDKREDGVKNEKLKLVIEGKISMSVEGSVEAIGKLVKDLSIE